MTLAVKGTPNAAASTSVTIPTHAVGDLIVIFAYHDGTVTVPTIPTASGTVPAWVTIDSAAGGSFANSFVTAQFVATATNHTSGTWTGSTGMVAVVLSGQASPPIGGHATEISSSSTQANAPAITMSKTDGSSILLEFYGHRFVTAWSAVPTGYTRQASVATEVCCNTKNSTTSDGSIAQLGTMSALGAYGGATVEVLAAPVSAQGNFFAVF